MYRVLLALGMLTLASLTQARPEHLVLTEKVSLNVEQVAEGLQNPWGMAFLPDDIVLITERPGRLQLVNLRDGSKQAVQGLPSVAQRGQGGLLDVALHPDFVNSRWVYFSYAASGAGGYGTEVARARLVGATLFPGGSRH